MRKGFTLIELLVVIAIIAILAAILFPVFAQAKLAAKKVAGLSHVKQIGTATHMYIEGYDDVLFPYRINGTTGNGCSGAACINPDYQKLAGSQGYANADIMFGSRSRDVTFFNQLLNPYVKNDDIWRCPGKATAWVGYDKIGNDTEPQFRSYGGQNSYAANSFVFSPIGGSLIHTEIENVSNTILLIDGSYYNTMPKQVCQLAGSTWIPSGSYLRYWKNLGNSYLFRWNGAANEPTDIEALKLINSRWNEQLNVVMADSSAKSRPVTKILADGPQVGYYESMWDPYKRGCL